MGSADSRVQVLEWVNKAFAVLDQISYYKLLSIRENASPADVRSAYYRLAARLHPDLYGRSLSAGEKQKMTTVFSRVSEAYKILSDVKKRNFYNEGLKQGKSRYDADAALNKRVAAPEDSLKNPGAKKFYKLAMEALRDKNPSSAKMNLQIALGMEPTSKLLRDAMASLEKSG